MVSVTFHVVAQSEYDDALSWYAKRDTTAADGFVAEVGRATAMMAAFPDPCAPYDRTHRYWLLRKYPFALVYRREEGTIVVVAVAHNRQRPGYWKDRI